MKKLTPKQKLDALPIKDKLALIKGIRENDPRVLQYYYKNFADVTKLKKNRQMDQMHYMIARQECEQVDGMGGNSDFDKYIFKKGYEAAMLA